MVAWPSPMSAGGVDNEKPPSVNVIDTGSWFVPQPAQMGWSVSFTTKYTVSAWVSPTANVICPFASVVVTPAVAG